MKTDYETREKNRIQNRLISASKIGDYELFSSIYDSNEISKPVLETAFHNACREGSLDIVRKILTDKKYQIEPQCLDNSPFISACSNGHTHIVEYLLKSPELNTHCPITSKISNLSGFSLACEAGELEVVKFLYENFSTNIDLYFNRDSAFRNSARNEKFDVLEYLIFTAKLDKTEKIQMFLESGILYKETVEKIEKMFSQREFKQQLELNVQLNSTPEHIKNKL